MINNDFIIEGYVINNPKKIKQVLDKYIIGQEDAKKDISQAVFNHIQILKGKETFSEQHTFLVGPSGCGKTEIFKILKQKSNIPIHILNMLDIVNLTNETFVDYLKDKLKNIKNGDIIVIDEYERILYNNNFYEMQCQILKILEGYNDLKTENLQKLTNNDEAKIRIKQFDKCLFICISTFNNLFIKNEKIGFKISKKEETTNKNLNKFTKEMMIEELLNRGIMSEILGKMTYIQVFNKLTINEYENIIKNPYCLYKQLKQKFKKEYKLEVFITNEVFIDIINNINIELSVKSLNSEIIKYFNDVLYNLDKSKKYNTAYVTLKGIKYTIEDKKHKNI